MDVKKVNLYLAKYGKYYSADKHQFLKEALMRVPEEYYDEVIATKLLNPAYMQIVSVAGGLAGIDRFLLGDKKMGLVKCLLFGGCGIVALIDIFKVQEKTLNSNFEKIMQSIAAVANLPVYQAPVAPMPIYAQPYAPVAPAAPVAPVAPAAPVAPVVAQTPVTPAAPAFVVPAAPKAPEAPVVTAPAAKPVEEKATPVVEAPKAEEKAVELKEPDIAPTPVKK